MDEIDGYLKQLQLEFIQGLGEQLADLESEMIRLEKHFSRDDMLQVARKIHTLKGNGGSFELPMITTIAHQLEEELFQNLLRKETVTKSDVDQAMKYFDLLGRVSSIYLKMQNYPQSDESDMASIKSELASLRPSHQLKILVADNLRASATLVERSVQSMSSCVSYCNDGLAALGKILSDQFDVALIGLQLKTLSGRAIISALTEQKNVNCRIIILASSSLGEFPLQGNIIGVLKRDQTMESHLQGLLEQVVRDSKQTGRLRKQKAI